MMPEPDSLSTSLLFPHLDLGFLGPPKLTNRQQISVYFGK